MNMMQEIIEDALEIDLPRPRQGKKRDLQVAYTRDLNERDLAMLGAGVQAKPITLLSLRNSHHALARLLAEGKDRTEASAITGYAPQTISQLCMDPAFQELLSYYEKQSAEIFVDFHVRLKNLSTDVIEHLAERLTAAPEKFSNQELRELLKLGADRTGFGPASKVQHNHASFSEDLLQAIKTEAAARSRSTIKTLELSVASADLPAIESGAD